MCWVFWWYFFYYETSCKTLQYIEHSNWIVPLICDWTRMVLSFLFLVLFLLTTHFMLSSFKLSTVTAFPIPFPPSLPWASFSHATFGSAVSLLLSVSLSSACHRTETRDLCSLKKLSAPTFDRCHDRTIPTLNLRVFKVFSPCCKASSTKVPLHDWHFLVPETFATTPPAAATRDLCKLSGWPEITTQEGVLTKWNLWSARVLQIYAK